MHIRKQADERGVISVIGLCAAAVILMMGLSVVHFVRTGDVVATEYERELELRLAAESAIETAAAGFESSMHAYGKLPDVGERMPITLRGVPMAADIDLYVFVEMVKDDEKDGQIYLIAAAIDRAAPHIEDGESWQRGKVVHALMRKEGKDRYVWQRWF